MKLFSKNEVNTKRQFEFDLAKAICILGMVFVHCFEEFPLSQATSGGTAHYLFVTVLNSLFGAGTFMICLGIGLAYTKKNEPNDFIKRGLITLGLGYLLNVFRFVIPSLVYFIGAFTPEAFEYLFACILYTDIMQFAGLAFLLFGLLKKIKLPDWVIGLVALYMSFLGWFNRDINVGNLFCNELLGLFVGTIDPSELFPYFAAFPILNWFIIVVFGYYFGKLLRRVENVEKFYLFSTIVSGVIVAAYMVISIPNKYGMMSGELKSYFQMATWEALIIMMGAVFIFGVYHYISKLFNEKVKSFITGLSVNINKTYCAHWVLIGCTSTVLWMTYYDSGDGIETYVVMIIACVIYVLSSLFGEIVRRRNLKKKESNKLVKN